MPNRQRANAIPSAEVSTMGSLLCIVVMVFASSLAARQSAHDGIRLVGDNFQKDLRGSIRPVCPLFPIADRTQGKIEFCSKLLLRQCQFLPQRFDIYPATDLAQLRCRQTWKIRVGFGSNIARFACHGVELTPIRFRRPLGIKLKLRGIAFFHRAWLLEPK